jgi:hypothetical protein
VDDLKFQILNEIYSQDMKWYPSQLIEKSGNFDEHTESHVNKSERKLSKSIDIQTGLALPRFHSVI